MPESQNPQPEPTAPPERILRAPLNTGRIALFFLMGICGLIMISNIAHLGSHSSKAAPRSIQPAKPAAIDPDNVAGFTQQQANQIAKLKQQAEELMKNSAAATSAALRPCEPSLAGIRSTAPDGTPILCGSDGAWHAANQTSALAPAAPAPTSAQEEAQRKKAELEKRTQVALASTTVAVDFSDQRDQQKTDAEPTDDHETSPHDPPAGQSVIPNPAPQPATNRAAPTTNVTPNLQHDTWFHYTGKLYRIFEGSILETVLTNRINGAFAGPINTMLTTNVYSHDHQALLVPQGTRCLGTVSAVNSVNQQRLYVAFHRCLMPDGYPLDLDKFTGLNQVGETAIRDLVNHHYLQIFGTSLAVGAIGGLAQIGNSTTAFAYDPGVAIRNGISQETAQESMQILNHFLNQLPTFVVREKTRIKIYISADLEVPAYDAHIIEPAI
jgi:type IV secretion system protein VirB10